MKLHRIGAVVAAGALVLTFAGSAFAITGHQDFPIAWDDPQYQGSEEDCKDVELKAGEVYWHFIQTQVPDGTESGKLTVSFVGGGSAVLDSYKLSGKTLHWQAVTEQVDLAGLESNVGGDGNLNLSHICSNTETTTTTTTTTTEPETTTTTTQQTTTTNETTTTQETTKETTTKSKTSKVEGVTAPSTDAMAPSSTPSTVSTGALLVLASVLALLLVLVPAAARSRR